jgi:hypothetical protein
MVDLVDVSGPNGVKVADKDSQGVRLRGFANEMVVIWKNCPRLQMPPIFFREIE